MFFKNQNHISQWEDFYFKYKIFENILRDKSYLVNSTQNKFVYISNSHNDNLYKEIGNNIVIIFLPVLESKFTSFENELYFQIDLIGYFIDENIKFFRLRLKQLRRHLLNLRILIEENNSKKEYFEKVYKRIRNSKVNPKEVDVNDDERNSILYESLIGEKTKKEIEIENNNIYFNNEKYIEYYNTYEMVFKELHKECVYLIRFLDQNIDIFKDVLMKYITEIKHLLQIISLNIQNSYEKDENIQERITYFNEIRFKFSNLINKTREKNKFNQYINILEDIKDEIETLFEEKYLRKYDYNPKTTLEIIQSNSDISPLSTIQIFTFGFLVSSIVSVIILELYLSSFIGFEMEFDVNFMSVFPLFRGFFMICLLLWMLGITVYVWKRNFINYRILFRFSNQSSSLYEILNRAAIFSFFSLSMFFIYILSRSQQINTIFHELKDHDTNYIQQGYKIFNDILPLSCYLLLIIYLLFPSSSKMNIFNYKGRKYFLILLSQCLLSPFYLLIDVLNFLFKYFSLQTSQMIKYYAIISKNTNDFKHIWFVDQFISFIGPIRDLEYVVCYSFNYNSNAIDKLDHCNSERLIVLIVAITPHLIRIFQCLRIVINTQSLYPQFINAGKYLFAIIASILAFYFTSYNFLFPYWLLFAVLSTIYFSYWDIKFDFGFLEKGKGYPLRENLSYKRWVYYLIVFFNLILRLGWILTISPQMMKVFLYPQFSSGLVFLLEIFRRGIFNFIRVEYEHVKLCQNFNVSVDIELPLRIIYNNSEGIYYVYDNNDKEINKELYSSNVNKDNIELYDDLVEFENENKRKENNFSTSKIIPILRRNTYNDYKNDDVIKIDEELQVQKENYIKLRSTINQKLYSHLSFN